MTLTPVQKRAAMKIAVDLAKADRQIHGAEVSLLNDCQRKLGLTDDELEMIHYLSLQECIEVLEDLPESEKAYDRDTSLETLKLITKLGFRIIKE